MENWRNEHGQPDFEYLQSLVADGDATAREKLRSIATDFDVQYDEATPDTEIAEKIRMAVRSENITTT